MKKNFFLVLLLSQNLSEVVLIKKRSTEGNEPLPIVDGKFNGLGGRFEDADSFGEIDPNTGVPLWDKSSLVEVGNKVLRQVGIDLSNENLSSFNLTHFATFGETYGGNEFTVHAFVAQLTNDEFYKARMTEAGYEVRFFNVDNLKHMDVMENLQYLVPLAAHSLDGQTFSLIQYQPAREIDIDTDQPGEFAPLPNVPHGHDMEGDAASGTSEQLPAPAESLDVKVLSSTPSENKPGGLLENANSQEGQEGLQSESGEKSADGLSTGSGTNGVEGSEQVSAGVHSSLSDVSNIPTPKEALKAAEETQDAKISTSNEGPAADAVKAGKKSGK